MQVFQIVHSASGGAGMGMVNEFTRWVWLMTSMDFLRMRILGELTFETQLIPSIFKHNFFSNNAELA